MLFKRRVTSSHFLKKQSRAEMSLALTKLISSVTHEAFMIKIRKVVTLPEIKEPETIYLHRDVTDALIITVTGVSGEVLSSTKSTQAIDLLI